MNDLTRKLVSQILKAPYNIKWSVQGLGMLRMYLSENLRLHIWHNDFRVPNVSTVHDHPWDFESSIVAGQITNKRYVPAVEGTPFMHNLIKCGEGGGLTEVPPRSVMLEALPFETYRTDESYNQDAQEIHETEALDGTITIIRRTFHKDTEHAHVFWQGSGWVSAEPREATQAEVKYAIAAAQIQIVLAK